MWVPRQALPPPRGVGTPILGGSRGTHPYTHGDPPGPKIGYIYGYIWAYMYFSMIFMAILMGKRSEMVHFGVLMPEKPPKNSSGAFGSHNTSPCATQAPTDPPPRGGGFGSRG